MKIVSLSSTLHKVNAWQDFLQEPVPIPCGPFENSIIKYYLFSYQALHKYFSSPNLDPLLRSQILPFVPSVSSICGKIILKKSSQSVPWLSEKELQTGSLWHEMKSDSFWWNPCMWFSAYVITEYMQDKRTICSCISASDTSMKDKNINVAILEVCTVTSWSRTFTKKSAKTGAECWKAHQDDEHRG